MHRLDQINEYLSGKIPRPPNPKRSNLDKDPDWEPLYREGVLRKSQLKHGWFYIGQSRNATIARWNKTRNRFEHKRTKFTDVFTDYLDHPEDDQGFDCFLPVAGFKLVVPKRRKT